MSIYEGITEGDFAKSVKKRLPICFCLDASGSMEAPTPNGKTRMEELTDAFNMFINAMKESEEVAASADIAIVKFGGTSEIVQNFKPLNKLEPVVLQANHWSQTPIGDAIKASLKMLEVRKTAYKQKGKKYYQPWLVVLTDGEPEGPNAVESMEEAIAMTVDLEKQNKLVVFNIGIGNEVDEKTLGRLSVKREKPIRADETDLGALFAFLGSSSESVVAGGDQDEILYGKLPVGEKFSPDMIAGNDSSNADSNSQDTSSSEETPSDDVSSNNEASTNSDEASNSEETSTNDEASNNALQEETKDESGDVDISGWCI